MDHMSMKIPLISLSIIILLNVLSSGQNFFMNAEDLNVKDRIEGWNFELSTSGGLTGKGLGGITAGSDGKATASDGRNNCQDQLLDEETKELDRLIRKSNPARWRKKYAIPGNPHGYADQILYTFKLTVKTSKGAQIFETTWYDQSAEKTPADLQAIVKQAWKTRDKATAKCRK